MTTLAQKLSRNTELRQWSHWFNKSGEFYIAMEDKNLAFTETEIDTTIEMWREGRPIWDIADTLKRNDTEITVLLLDMAHNGAIETRPGGIFGDTLRDISS